MSPADCAQLVGVELVTSRYLDHDQPTRPIKVSPGRLLVSRRLRDEVSAIAQPQPAKATDGGAR